MLLPVEIDSIPKKRGRKQNLVWPNGSTGDKIVFTLLAKVVVFYVWPTAINVQGFSFEFVSKSSFWDME